MPDSDRMVRQFVALERKTQWGGRISSITHPMGLMTLATLLPAFAAWVTGRAICGARSSVKPSRTTSNLFGPLRRTRPMASTDEQKGPAPVEKPIIYKLPARHLVSTSVGLDTAIVAVLAVYEQQADPADPFQICFDVVQLQRLHDLTHPKIVDNVAQTLKRPPIPGSDYDILVDETVIYDVGAGFRELGKPAKRYVVVPSGGATQEGYRWTIGQQVLFSKLTTALHKGELKIAKGLTEAPALEAAIRQANPAATVEHNPLLFAAAIALWHSDKWRRGSLGRREPRVLHGYARQKGFRT